MQDSHRSFLISPAIVEQFIVHLAQFFRKIVSLTVHSTVVTRAAHKSALVYMRFSDKTSLSISDGDSARYSDLLL